MMGREHATVSTLQTFAAPAAHSRSGVLRRRRAGRMRRRWVRGSADGVERAARVHAAGGCEWGMRCPAIFRRIVVGGASSGI